jgi:hypothetical protein
MQLQDALVEISAIRRQLALSERFHGYRAAPVAASGMLAFVAAAAQAVWVAGPVEDLTRYLALWIGVAAAALLLCLGGVVQPGGVCFLPIVAARNFCRRLLLPAGRLLRAVAWRWTGSAFAVVDGADVRRRAISHGQRAVLVGRKESLKRNAA